MDNLTEEQEFARLLRALTVDAPRATVALLKALKEQTTAINALAASNERLADVVAAAQVEDEDSEHPASLDG